MSNRVLSKYVNICDVMEKHILVGAGETLHALFIFHIVNKIHPKKQYFLAKFMAAGRNSFFITTIFRCNLSQKRVEPPETF